MSIPFETVEKTNGDDPLISGLFLDVGSAVDKEETIKKTIREMKKLNPEFKPPFIVMDLATPQDVKITGEAEGYGGLDEDETMLSDDYVQNPSVKLLVPCSQVVDLSKLGGVVGSTKVVKCNAMIPVFRWFQAANLVLHFFDKTGRVVPFPLDQEDGGTTFHMLPVNPAEFQLYQQILDFGVTQEGLEKGFETSAKFAYELLGRRGIKEISADEVDSMIAHIMVGHMNGKCNGILLHRASRVDLDELKESHFVYY